MRLQQVKNLDENELGMLLYIVNVLAPIEHPSFEITPSWLPSIRHNLLLQKVFRSQSHIKPESAPVLRGLWGKLHAKWDFEVTENANTTDTKPSGPNIPSEQNGVHLETTQPQHSETTSSAGSEQQRSGSNPPKQDGQI